MIRFSAFVHANVAFNVVENPFVQAFINGLRPMYKLPSRYVLQHTTLDAEFARVKLEEHEQLKKRKFITLLIDGWEDAAGRSLYGTVASEVRKAPTVLGLSDLTGERGTADAMVRICSESLDCMDIRPCQVAALCTDNPSVMISAWTKFESLYPWSLVSVEDFGCHKCTHNHIS